MIGSIRAELLGLRTTRAAWGLAAAALLLSAARVAMVLGWAGTAAGVPPGSATATLTLASAAGSGAVLVVLLGAATAAGEFRHATLTAALLVVPDRRRLVAAKALAAALVGALASVALTALGYGGATATGIGAPLPGGDLAVLLAAVAAGGAFWGAAGVAIGLLARNQVLALLVPLAWLLVVEPLAGAYGLRGLVPWLPGALPGELAGLAGPGALPPWAALALMVAYALALVGAAAGRLVRSDVA